jgi:hypothetical protein
MMMRIILQTGKGRNDGARVITPNDHGMLFRELFKELQLQGYLFREYVRVCHPVVMRRVRQTLRSFLFF